jgi:hypothetical protein
VTVTLMACAQAPPPNPYGEQPPLSPDQAWVASTCDPASLADTAGWNRHRLGDITIAAPPDFTVSEGTPYSLRLRGGSGSIALTLHRNARYLFDDMNRARRNQNWCRASFGGYQTEVLGWKDIGTFGLVARWEATWGGQDVGKWLFAQMTAFQLKDAQLLRDMLHTIKPVPVSPGFH